MARVRLNALNVRSLPANLGRRVRYFDEVCPGLVLRVSSTSSRTWWIIYWRRGRQRQFRLGRLEHLDLAGARAVARTLLARIALGEDPAAVRAAQRASALTIETLARAALDALELRPKTEKEWRRLVEREIIPALGDEPAATLTRQRIRAWGERLAKRSPSIALHAWAILRRCYSWGVQTDRLPGSPFVALEPPARRRVSTRVLSTPELGALLLTLGTLPGAYSDALELLLLTMVRREMVLGMRSHEVEGLDGAGPRWVVPAARCKGARDHVVPLSGRAVAVVRRRLVVAQGDVLFPPLRPDSLSPTMGWASGFAARVRRGLGKHLGWKPEPWKVHSLRHTAATHLREDLGVAPDTVRLLLGHARRDISGRYDRAEMLPERRTALEAWAGWLSALPAAPALRREA